MHPETKAEVLAALREVYDGAWTRHLGSDGGRTLAWQGKVGLVFGCHRRHRWPLQRHRRDGRSVSVSRRLEPAGKGAVRAARCEHVGAATKQMRKELAEAVARIVCRPARPSRGRSARTRPSASARTISLVVRLRGAVERDRRTREIEAVYGAEGTARIGLALERLLAGLDTLGVDRAKAMEIVEAIALDSVPPARRRAYEYLHNSTAPTETTPKVAAALGLPTVTVRRVLEELAAYELIKRTSQGQGNPDLWSIVPGTWP